MQHVAAPGDTLSQSRPDEDAGASASWISGPQLIGSFPECCRPWTVLTQEFWVSLKVGPRTRATSTSIHEGDLLDEAQMANWVKQAAALPGWIP